MLLLLLLTKIRSIHNVLSIWGRYIMFMAKMRDDFFVSPFGRQEGDTEGQEWLAQSLIAHWCQTREQTEPMLSVDLVLCASHATECSILPIKNKNKNKTPVLSQYRDM